MKSSFSLIEILVYIIIAWLTTVYGIVFMQQLFSLSAASEEIDLFSKNYNWFIQDIYWLWMSKRAFSWNASTWIILYNNNQFIWLWCNSSGIFLTTQASGSANLTWSSSQKNYSGFVCNMLSGQPYQSGYWINININLSKKNIQNSYFINP